MSEYKPNLTFSINEPKLVKFLFNEPLTVNTKFGQRYRYAVEFNNEEYQMLATQSLHTLIMQNSPLRDKSLTINKIKIDDKIVAFTINGMTMDDLKKKERGEFKSVLDGGKDVEPTPVSTARPSISPSMEPYTSIDDCWREINNINKSLKNVMKALESLESKSNNSNQNLEVPF